MQEVKKRSVFYLSGYDPRGARHYYNLYKKEAKKQEKVDGTSIEISKKRRLYSKHIYRWEIIYQDSCTTTLTDYYFLSWDDYIREKWGRGTWKYAKSLWEYSRLYIFRGLFLRYIKKTKETTVTIFIPFLFLIASLMFSIIFPILIYNELKDIVDFYLLFFTTSVIGFIVFVLSMRLSERLPISWLNRVFTFSAFLSKGFDEKLKERIYGFSQDIVDIIRKSNPDEFVIVSHSVGTILTIPLVESLIEKYDSISGETTDTSIVIVTLGECIPLVSGVPENDDFKSMLRNIATFKKIKWIDYTSKIDGACFPGLNFFEDSDIELPYKENYQFISPRFHTLYKKNHYLKIKRNKYQSHFLYLMATDKKTGYNYFRMTAGPNKVCT